MLYSSHQRAMETQSREEEARSRGRVQLVRNPGNTCEPQGPPITRLNYRFSSHARSIHKQAGLLSHPPAVGLVSPPELRNPRVILARERKSREECLLIRERMDMLFVLRKKEDIFAGRNGPNQTSRRRNTSITMSGMNHRGFCIPSLQRTGRVFTLSEGHLPTNCLYINHERSTSIGLFQGRTPLVAFAFSLPGTHRPTAQGPSPDQTLLASNPHVMPAPPTPGVSYIVRPSYLTVFADQARDALCRLRFWEGFQGPAMSPSHANRLCL
jgi:hypothetical protein